MQNDTHAKIAVLGAGIMGLSSAYALVRGGHDVTLYEPKNLPAHNASWKAGGMLAPYSEIEHMPQQWIEAGLAGIAAWADFAQNHDIDFHQTGSLLVAHKEDTYILERFRSHLPDGIKNSVEISALEPQLSSRFAHGLYLKEEAHLNPRQTMSALIDFLHDKITVKHESKTPEALNTDFDYVLDCRGFSAANDKNTLRGVKGEIAVVRNKEFKLERPVRLMHPRYPLYIVPRADHHFMIGATMIESADDTHVSLRSGLELMSALYSLHPSFGEAEIIEITSGIRPAYSDNLPYITREGSIIRANGLFRHGYLLAPVMAQCIKDMLENKTHKFVELFGGQSDEIDHQRSGKNIQSAA